MINFINIIDCIFSTVCTIILIASIFYFIETLILICVVIYSNIVNKSDPLPPKDKRGKRDKD